MASPTPAQLLAQALRCHQAGDLSQAELLYQQVLQADPHNFDAHHLLGALAHQRGQNDVALHFLTAARRLRPDVAELHRNLGIVCKAAGRLEEALDSYREALHLQPAYWEAHCKLAEVLLEMGRADQAEAHWRQALQLRPNLAQTHNNLGSALLEQGKAAEAAACFQRAIRFAPDHAVAHHNLGTALHRLGQPEAALASYRHALRLDPHLGAAWINLGVVLKNQGQLPEAVASFQQTLQRNPNQARAHNELGMVLREQGKLVDAFHSFQQALRLDPRYAEAHNHLGMVLKEQDRLDEAIASFRQALQLNRDLAEAHNNLGTALRDQGKLEEALASFQQAISLKPDFAEAHMNLGMAFLQLGQLERGWPEYEWRRRLAPSPPQPALWDGAALAGRSILVDCLEQGLGDALQFVRYAPLVKERGGTVILQCPEPLTSILSGCAGIDQVVVSGSQALAAGAVGAPLMSLPGIFGTSLASIPVRVPYLAADAALIDSWRQELAKYRTFKVGIAWQGNPRYKGDRHRSIPLAQFAPLVRVEGVRLFSLQKGWGAEQLEQVAGRLEVVDFGPRLDEAAGAFMDTAAIMKNLDLVITSDTATAHLAGALAVPVWVALQKVPDWRWLLDRPDSPWYPTLRLFRQSEPGNWGEVFERMAQELQKLLGTSL
jgi:tetratricopeptide (TPR) repeat protein